MRILAFAASSSRQSINKQLVSYAANHSGADEVELLDLNDFELPLYSVDKEKELGKPDLALKFIEHIGQCDALIISFAEHNGCYSTAFKNLFDWCSRIERNFYQNKPMVMLATSPGSRGGASVLNLAVSTASFFGGDVRASLSIPNFYENFDVETGILVNKELALGIKRAVDCLK
jgi:NAD(P)H-dependent FMN reductase